MSDIDIVLLISRWIHLTAAIVAVGGAVFTRFVLIPASNSAQQEGQKQSPQPLNEAIRRRWMPLVHGCIGLLLITGFLNFFLLVVRPKVAPMPYHPIFGVKLLTALFVFFISIALAGKSPGFAKLRTNRVLWLNVLLVGAAVIVLLSGILNQIRSAGI